MAKAVLVSESLIQIAAESPEDVTVTVYSDGQWRSETPEWVTVTPASGYGTQDVVLSFTDNLRDGAVDNPRRADVIFRGDRLMSVAKLQVRQDGDKFRDLASTSFADLASMPVESFVMIQDALVVAVASNGFLACSDDTNVFVECSENIPAVGDKVSFYATTDKLHSYVSLENLERLSVVSSSNPVIYTDNNITETFDSFAPAAVSYVTLEGVLNGKSLEVNGALTATCELENPAEDLGLSALNGHKVKISGYVLGKETNTVYLLPVGPVVDNGVDEIIYFADNFDWLAPIAEASGAGDSMGKAGDDAAKNGYTSAGCENFAAELANQGYEDLFPSSKTIYIQKNYLKFSKGSNANGIKLPAVNYGGTTNIVLTFDWGTHVGSGGADKVNLVVEVEGNGEVVNSGFDHTAGAWTWQREIVLINGVDDNTRIIIKPSTFTGTATSGYYRWYLDNIKIAQGEGAAPGGPVEVFSDNFDWVQPFVEADIEKGNTQGDSMLDNVQYTVGSSYSLEGFTDALSEMGYEALFPSSKAIYVMKGNYLKFSKGKNINGIRLPKMDFGGKSKIVLSFDWGINVGADGQDPVELEVTVEGNGSVNGAQKTSPLLHTAGSWEWQTETIEIDGVDNDTRITIRPTTFVGEMSTGYYRWFLDNVNVSAK